MATEEAAPVGEVPAAKSDTEFMTPENTRMLIAIRTEMDERFRNNPKIGRNSLPDASDLWDELTQTYNSQYPDSVGRLPSCLKKRWEKLVSSYRKDTKFLVQNEWELKGRQLSQYFPAMDQSFRDKADPEFITAVDADPLLVAKLLEGLQNGQAYDKSGQTPKKRVRNKVPKFRRNPINPKFLDYEQPASAKLKNYKCIVPLCKNTARNTAYTKVRFIMLPRTNPAARKGYLDVIGVPYTNARDIFICTKHFPADQVDLKAKYVVKNGTLPTIFLEQEEFDKEAADNEANGISEEEGEVNTFLDDQPPSAWHTRKNFRCIVPSCRNRVRSVDWSKIRFSEIPMKGPKRRKYLEDCGLLDKLPVESLDRRHMLICTKHFLPKQIDFFRKPHVKAGEVPSLFLDENGEDGNETYDDRLGKRSFFGKNASTPESVNRDILLLELLVANNPFLPDRSQRDHKVRLQWEKIVTVYNAARVEPLELTSRTCKNRVERFREKARYNMVRVDPKYESAGESQKDHIENMINQVHQAAAASEQWEAEHGPPKGEKTPNSAHSVVYRCMVEGCNSRRVGRDDSDEIRYYHVPNDPEVREVWLKAAGFYGCTANNTVMCSRHFEDECIKDNGRLKKGSVPTLFVEEYDDDPTGTDTAVEGVESEPAEPTLPTGEAADDGEEGVAPAVAEHGEAATVMLPSEYDTFDPKLKFGRHGLSQRHCVIAACPSHQNRLRQQKVGMFKCPQVPPEDSDPGVLELFQKWADAISLENAYPWTHKHLICSAHFDDDMLRYHKTAGKVTLTKGAYPSRKLRSLDWPGTRDIMEQLMRRVEEEEVALEAEEGENPDGSVKEEEELNGETEENEAAAAEVAEEGEEAEEVDEEEPEPARRSPRKRKAGEEDEEKKESPKKRAASPKKAKTPENVYEYDEEEDAPQPSTSAKSPRRSTRSSGDFEKAVEPVAEKPATVEEEPAEEETAPAAPRKRGRPKRNVAAVAEVPETVNKRKRFSPRMVSREGPEDEGMAEEAPPEAEQPKAPAKGSQKSTEGVKKTAEGAKSPARASESAKSPARATEASKSPVKATEASKLSAKATEASKPAGKASAAGKTTAKAVESGSESTKPAEAAKPAGKQTQTTKAGTKTAETSKQPAKAVRIVKSPEEAVEAPKVAVKTAEPPKGGKVPPEPTKMTTRGAKGPKATQTAAKPAESPKPAVKGTGAPKANETPAEPAKTNDKSGKSTDSDRSSATSSEKPKHVAAVVEPVRTRAKAKAEPESTKTAATVSTKTPTAQKGASSPKRAPKVTESIQTRGQRKNVVVRSPKGKGDQASGAEEEGMASGSRGRKNEDMEVDAAGEITAADLEADLSED